MEAGHSLQHQSQPQSALTAPDQGRHKPGQHPSEGVELGAKQMQSEARLEPGILEQHQGRHQEHWDGLRSGPEQSSGKENLVMPSGL